MKYLLGIGPTILQKYKKYPSLRIFLDDIMIDDFSVQEKNISDKKWFCKDNRLMSPWSASPNPKTHKIYIIDQHTLQGKKKLRIEVTNDDSNYTNGFMTKSTIIDLRHIFLLPLPFIDVFKNSAFDSRESEKYWQLCDSMKPLIHDKFGGQVDFVRRIYHHNEIDRYYGYPYPFRMFWNGDPTLGHVGGSGVFTVDLVQKSGIYLFDSIDDEFSESHLHITNHDRAPYDLPPGPPTTQELKITGFQLCRSFLFWCQLGKLDKYFYENQ
jgi:hypothetical protein